MGENSKIEWTDHTFNPWLGCTKVSPACDHCYAEGWAKRAGKPPVGSRQAVSQRASHTGGKGAGRTQRNCLLSPTIL
jgi:protein gp37